MTNELAVYKVGDYYWFIAPDAVDALERYVAMTDDDQVCIDDVEKLSPDALASLKYFDDIYERTGQRSFAQQVQKLKRNGEWEPGIFATADI